MTEKFLLTGSMGFNCNCAGNLGILWNQGQQSGLENERERTEAEPERRRKKGRKERGKEGRKGGRKDGWKEKISEEGGHNQIKLKSKYFGWVSR